MLHLCLCYAQKRRRWLVNSASPMKGDSIVAKVPLNRSVKPLHSGVYGLVNLCSKPSAFPNSPNNFARKQSPLSVSKILNAPKTQITESTKNLATSSALPLAKAPQTTASHKVGYDNDHAFSARRERKWTQDVCGYEIAKFKVLNFSIRVDRMQFA